MRCSSRVNNRYRNRNMMIWMWMWMWVRMGLSSIRVWWNHQYQWLKISIWDRLNINKSRNRKMKHFLNYWVLKNYQAKLKNIDIKQLTLLTKTYNHIIR